MRPADFLVEIGTEELPPKALRDLMHAFADELRAGFERERLAHGALEPYATPRRLAVLVHDLASRQEDRATELKGPPVSVAFDAGGRPTAAARAFAERCGVPVEELGRTRTDRGEWLSRRVVEEGRSARDLLPRLVEEALGLLPIPRRMRWGASAMEFVRPVRWVLMLHGSDLVPGQVLGSPAGKVSYGHRFLAGGPIEVAVAADYGAALERRGFVVADFAERRRRIVAAVERAAAAAGGQPVAGDALFDEVTALTEWPVALVGRFDEAYLDLPREVIVATLTSHQRYFPIAAPDGRLQAEFVVVANLESKDPARVREGNERVVRPRLADAAFFRAQDGQVPFAERQRLLGDVVYSRGLGSLHDKSARVARLSVEIASRMHIDAAGVERAALLSRCDLTTGMVGEFPELQGVMGGYYAADAGEPAAVARAIPGMYLPRHAGDALPESDEGRALSLADRLDSLAGHFASGTRPTGTRDPFGLRRTALGVVRILVERELDLDLPALLASAVADQPVAVKDAPGLVDELYDFIVERMRAWYLETRGIAAEVFEAVRVRRPPSLADFDRRLQAVAAFAPLEAAESLAAANKRIANILRQSGREEHGAVEAALLESPAERRLHEALGSLRAEVGPLLRDHAYADALERMTALREPVDRFFDEVMVMSEDAAVRRNRLAMLAGLRVLFLEIADISRLSIG